MSIKRDRQKLRTYFETGDRPTEEEFSELIESGINQKDDDVHIDNSDPSNPLVGIGTENPAAKLNVQGLSQDENNEGIVIVEGKNGSQDANLRFGIVNGSRSWIQAHGQKPLHINGAGNDTIINPNGGDVGIGKTNPSQKLHVNGNIATSGQIIGDMSNKAPQDKTLQIINNSQIQLYSRDHNTAPGRIVIGADKDPQNVNSGKLLFSKHLSTGGWENNMIIDHAGNVGIGETNPGSRLHVQSPSASDTGLTLTGQSNINPGDVLSTDGSGRVKWVPKTDVTSGLWKKATNTDDIQNGNPGNVGIGLNNPQAKLDIEGSAENENSKGILRLKGAGTGKDLRLGVEGRPGIAPYTWIQSHGAVPLKLNPHSAGNITTLNENGGNVGIGINDPKENLHINGNIRLDEAMIQNRKYGTELNVKINHADESQGGKISVRRHDSDGVSPGGIVFSASKPLGSNVDNGFTFLQYQPDDGNGAKWPRCLTIDKDRNSYFWDNRIHLRGGNDKNHGLGWFGERFDTVESFGYNNTINGPALYGYSGGALGIVKNNDTTHARIALKWTDAGYVGIGYNDPKHLLHVGTKDTDIDHSYHYINGQGSSVVKKYDRAYQTVAISIYAEGRVLADEFNAYSDARIKNIQGVSDSKTDLGILSEIEITDYLHKDEVVNGSRKSKKVIGQQLKEVFPQAVSMTQEVIPDIYSKAEVKGEWLIIENDLKKGDRVRLIIGDRKEIAAVLEAEKHQFKVDTELNDDKVFVYGREVNDFHVVDYDAIAMLNVSATQELNKKIDQQAEEIKQLKTLVTELMAKIQA